MHGNHLWIVENFRCLTLPRSPGSQISESRLVSQTPHLLLIVTKFEDHWCVIFRLVRLELTFKCIHEVTYSFNIFFIDQFSMPITAFWGERLMIIKQTN